MRTLVLIAWTTAGALVGGVSAYAVNPEGVWAAFAALGAALGFLFGALVVAAIREPDSEENRLDRAPAAEPENPPHLRQRAG
jgi:hypothetical protein